MENILVVTAREFAREKHKEQKRKYTGEPYFVHLEEVAELTRMFGLGSEAEIVAYLHDTVEDTATTHAELVERFGVQIAMGVYALTNAPKDSGNRKMRKEADRTRLSRSVELVQSVKCADLISNARDIVTYDPDFSVVFLDEMDELLKVMRLAHKGIHTYANMVCQVEQLYMVLNRHRATKAKEAANDPQSSPQTEVQSDNTVHQAGHAA